MPSTTSNVLGDVLHTSFTWRKDQHPQSSRMKGIGKGIFQLPKLGVKVRRHVSKYEGRCRSEGSPKFCRIHGSQRMLHCYHGGCVNVSVLLCAETDSCRLCYSTVPLLPQQR